MYNHQLVIFKHCARGPHQCGRQGSEMTCIKFEKEERKFLFTYDMILYVENLKKTTDKLLKLLKELVSFLNTGSICQSK